MVNNVVETTLFYFLNSNVLQNEMLENFHFQFLGVEWNKQYMRHSTE